MLKRGDVEILEGLVNQLSQTGGRKAEEVCKVFTESEKLGTGDVGH